MDKIFEIDDDSGDTIWGESGDGCGTINIFTSGEVCLDPEQARCLAGNISRWAEAKEKGSKLA